MPPKKIKYKQTVSQFSMLAISSNYNTNPGGSQTKNLENLTSEEITKLAPNLKEYYEKNQCTLQEIQNTNLDSVHSAYTVINKMEVLAKKEARLYKQFIGANTIRKKLEIESNIKELISQQSQLLANLLIEFNDRDNLGLKRFLAHLVIDKKFSLNLAEYIIEEKNKEAFDCIQMCNELDKNFLINQVLVLGCAFDNEMLVRELIPLNPAVNIGLECALHHTNISLARLLINSPQFETNSQNFFGFTPLIRIINHVISTKNFHFLELASLLLHKEDFDINIQIESLTIFIDNMQKIVPTVPEDFKKIHCFLNDLETQLENLHCPSKNNESKMTLDQLAVLFDELKESEEEIKKSIDNLRANSFPKTRINEMLHENSQKYNVIEREIKRKNKNPHLEKNKNIEDLYTQYTEMKKTHDATEQLIKDFLTPIAIKEFKEKNFKLSGKLLSIFNENCEKLGLTPIHAGLFYNDVSKMSSYENIREVALSQIPEFNRFSYDEKAVLREEYDSYFLDEYSQQNLLPCQGDQENFIKEMNQMFTDFRAHNIIYPR